MGLNYPQLGAWRTACIKLMFVGLICPHYLKGPFQLWLKLPPTCPSVGSGERERKEEIGEKDRWKIEDRKEQGERGQGGGAEPRFLETE